MWCLCPEVWEVLVVLDIVIMLGIVWLSEDSEIHMVGFLVISLWMIEIQGASDAILLKGSQPREMLSNMVG